MPEFEVELSPPINDEDDLGPDAAEAPLPNQTELNTTGTQPETAFSFVGITSTYSGKGSGVYRCHLTIMSGLTEPFSPKKLVGIVDGVMLTTHMFSANLHDIIFTGPKATQTITLVFDLSKAPVKPVGLHYLYLDDIPVKDKASMGPYTVGKPGSGRWVIKENIP